MTLGGLALAIGILVDESTVTIENVQAHLARGQSLVRAVSDSRREIALPLLVSMLCVLAVFVPSFFMTGAARALFVPLSLAVGFSMVASYLLSSSFVPILSAWMLRREHRATTEQSFFGRVQQKYGEGVQNIMSRRGALVSVYLAGCVVVIVLLLSAVGREIFPNVDVGQFELRFHATTGTRIEVTEQIASG